jgi:periplasmic copper chaperone A
MIKVFARCFAMLAATLCFMQVALASDIMVMNAMARASLTPVAKSGAVYLSIMNHGNTDDKLLSLSATKAATAEIHETTMDGDVMKMRALETALNIPAGATVEMKPGGVHIMLTGLKAPMKKGDVVAVTLVFERAGPVKLDVPVGDVAAEHDHGE